MLRSWSMCPKRPKAWGFFYMDKGGNNPLTSSLWRTSLHLCPLLPPWIFPKLAVLTLLSMLSHQHVIKHPCKILLDSVLLKLGLCYVFLKENQLNCWLFKGFDPLKCVMRLLLCFSYLTSCRNSGSFCANSKEPGSHQCNVGGFPFACASFLTLCVWEWPLNRGEISVFSHLCLNEYFCLSNRIKFVSFSKWSSRLLRSQTVAKTEALLQTHHGMC